MPTPRWCLSMSSMIWNSTEANGSCAMRCRWPTLWLHLSAGRKRPACPPFTPTIISDAGVRIFLDWSAFLGAKFRGRPVVAQLAPEKDDYFLLKPKHSAFFSTNLEILLNYLGLTTLILTGMAGDICVLFSANDAYMRDFRIIVPPDCIASEDPERNQQLLTLMQRVLKAEVSLSTELTFERSRVILPI